MTNLSLSLYHAATLFSVQRRRRGSGATSRRWEGDGLRKTTVRPQHSPPRLLRDGPPLEKWNDLPQTADQPFE